MRATTPSPVAARSGADRVARQACAAPVAGYLGFSCRFAYIMKSRLPPASLSENQIAHILSRALPRHPLKSFEPPTGGLINAMYRLYAEGLQEPFVLRVYSRDPSACQKE